jgi:hypothetical protein
MKKLVFIIILSVSGMTFAQDLMWGLTVDAAMKKQDDISGVDYNIDYNNSIYSAFGAHINYRVFRKLYVQSGLMVHYNKIINSTYTENWSSYNEEIKIVQKSIDIPIQLSIKIWKGLSVYSGISVSKYFLNENFENSHGYISTNKRTDLTINKTPYGLQYAFNNGLTIGVNRQALQFENGRDKYYALRLSYDIGQYEWQ